MAIEWLSATYFDNSLLNYVIFFAFIAGGFLFARTVLFFNAHVVRKLTAKTKTELDDVLLELVATPFVVYVIAFSTWVGWQFLKFPTFPMIDTYFGHLLYLVVAFNSAWLIARMSRALIDHYVTPLASKTKTDLDDTLIPILRKLIGFTIYAIALIMVLNHFGQEIGPLLAGLGIGGLAFALAAKDLLGNIFGSITVLTDKPFSIGQRVRVGGHDGFVKEISVRTTKIKTLDGTMLYVPNATFTSTIVENVSREPTRKVLMNIGVTYDTSNAKMKKAVEILNKILAKQKGLDGKHLVYFTEFGDFSLKILVIYYIKDKDNILPIKHDVNMQIKEQFEKAKIDMAFPTQTIELKK